jgi:hypothetical protein
MLTLEQVDLQISNFDAKPLLAILMIFLVHIAIHACVLTNCARSFARLSGTGTCFHPNQVAIA